MLGPPPKKGENLMRIICTFVVCALFVAMCRPSVAAEKKGSGVAASDQIGRYQLIQGKLTSTDGSGSYISTDAMYKLDTVSGKLYLCYVSQSSQVSENGAVKITRTCTDFERVWETIPPPAQPAMK